MLLILDSIKIDINLCDKCGIWPLICARGRRPPAQSRKTCCAIYYRSNAASNNEKYSLSDDRLAIQCRVYLTEGVGFIDILSLIMIILSPSLSLSLPLPLTLARRRRPNANARRFDYISKMI